MSILSKATGIRINPLKGQFKIERPNPLGAVQDVVQNPLPVLAALAPGGLLTKGIGALSALGGRSGGSSDSAIPDEAFGGPTGISGVLSKGVDFLKGNNGKNALGLAQGVNAALQQRKAMDLAKQALGSAEGAYAERAPLRAAALSGMLNPQTPDLAPLRAIMNTGNPYAMGGQ